MEHVTDECQCGGKVCKSCKVLKCIGTYRPYSKKNPTLKKHCQPCVNERHRAWVEAHPKQETSESRKEYKRLYYLRNKEQQSSSRQEYYTQYKLIYKVRDAHRFARKWNAEGSFTVEEWVDILAKYDYTCLWCRRKEPDIDLTIDHVVPFSRGGTNHVDNLQPLCLSCNIRKNDRTMDFRPQNA